MIKKKRSVVLDELREAENKVREKPVSGVKTGQTRPKKRKTVNIQPESGERTAKKDSKDSDDIKVYSTRPTYADTVAPSVIRDVLPSDLIDETVSAGDYMVEIGGTTVPRRFYRSFFAEISSGATWPTMLHELTEMSITTPGGDMDIALHVRGMSTEVELDELNRRYIGLSSDLATVTDPSKRDAIKDELADIKYRQRKLRMESERSFRVTLQVILSGTDLKEFKMFCNSILSRFSSKSIHLRAFDTRQLEALLGVLPTAAVPSFIAEHAISMETSNLADMFLFSLGGLTHKSGVMLGVDSMGRPVFFDQWHKKLPNQHMVIMGQSGAGKTYTTQVIMHRSMHIGRQIAVIDWKGEHRDFFLLTGLPYIEFGDMSPDTINPYELEITENIDGSKYVDIEGVSNMVQGLVFKMISVYDKKALSGKVKVFIGTAIREQYEDANITRDPKSLYSKEFIGGSVYMTKKKEMPTLSGLYSKMAASNNKEIKTAAEMLKPFTKLGNNKSYSIFDAQSTIMLKGMPGIGFAINKLDPDIMRPIALSAISAWLNENFAKANVMQKKIIFIEECQNIFDDPDVGGPFAESAYREFRATNTGVCAITQGLEVFSRSKAGISAIKNSPIRIIGRQDAVDIVSIKDKLALTDGEAAFLLSKREEKGKLIIKIEDESDIVRINASPTEHMMFTTNPEDPAYKQRKQILKTRFADYTYEPQKPEEYDEYAV